MATGSAEDIEEERRLLYVAMTRAKDRLVLVVPQRFYTHQQAKKGDKHLYAARTRFIPSSIVNHFELQTWPLAARDYQGGSRPAGVTVDIVARMRGMWRSTGT